MLSIILLTCLISFFLMKHIGLHRHNAGTSEEYIQVYQFKCIKLKSQLFYPCTCRPFGGCRFVIDVNGPILYRAVCNTGNEATLQECSVNTARSNIPGGVVCKPNTLQTESKYAETR